MVLGSLNHPALGDIVVAVRANASRVTARWKGGAVHLSVPPGFDSSRIPAILDQLAPRLLAARPRLSYSLGDRLVFTGITFEIVSQSLFPSKVIGRAVLPVARVGVGTDIDFTDTRASIAISDFLHAIARRVAPKVLLPVARDVAERVGRTPARWVISNGHRVLGVCDSKGIVSLSYLLVFLPDDLREYIICHELAHLSEMNHSPRFHALLDHYLDGREKRLVSRLRNYQWPVLRR